MTPTFDRLGRRAVLATWVYAIALWVVILILFVFVAPGTVGQFLCFLLVPFGTVPVIYLRHLLPRLRSAVTDEVRGPTPRDHDPAAED